MEMWHHLNATLQCVEFLHTPQRANSELLLLSKDNGSVGAALTNVLSSEQQTFVSEHATTAKTHSP